MVADEAALAAWVGAMLRDPARRDAAGEAARTAVARFATLPAETAAMLQTLLRRPS